MLSSVVAKAVRASGDRGPFSLSFQDLCGHCVLKVRKAAADR
jgi:hypothetical protein